VRNLSAMMKMNHLLCTGTLAQAVPTPSRFRDKLASDRFIMESGMNYTPFHLVFNVEQVKAALQDIRERKAFPVSIRFKGRGMQPFKPNLSIEAAYDFCVHHFAAPNATALGIYEQTEDYDQYRQWNGEIQLNADGTLNAHYNPCSKGIKMRDALASPDALHVRGVTWNYKPLRWAVDYLCRFGVDIIGPVVELSAFEVPVGVKHERVVIWEVRNF
jgi:hypothetical protein